MKPIPDDIEEKKQAWKEEIKKKYEFFSTVAKTGAKFMFGDKVFYYKIMHHGYTVCPRLLSAK